jgi:rhodanese-related sulfurtransferase
MKRVDHRQVADLIRGGASVIDVLPRHEYDAGHIIGAIHVPLARVLAYADACADKSHPVVVYCRDALCDLSARAAAQLELTGFSHVFHYLRGKADWMVRGAPMEPPTGWSERGAALPYFLNNLVPAARQAWVALTRRAAVWNSMRDDLPKLAPGDPAPAPPSADGRAVVAVVLDKNGVLLGAIEGKSSGASAGVSALDAMNPAPQTIRPDMTPRLAAVLLRARPYLLVTTEMGKYLGRYVPAPGGED